MGFFSGTKGALDDDTPPLTKIGVYPIFVQLGGIQQLSSFYINSSITFTQMYVLLKTTVKNECSATSVDLDEIQFTLLPVDPSPDVTGQQQETDDASPMTLPL